MQITKYIDEDGLKDVKKKSTILSLVIWSEKVLKRYSRCEWYKVEMKITKVKGGK